MTDWRGKSEVMGEKNHASDTLSTTPAMTRIPSGVVWGKQAEASGF